MHAWAVDARVPAGPSGLVVLLVWGTGSVVFLIHPLPEGSAPVDRRAGP